MKLIGYLILLSAFGVAQAQQDIVINNRGPYVDLARSVAWNGAGIGGFLNSYIFTPQSPDTNTCVFVRNNDATSTHSFTITVWQTADQRVTAFQGAGQYWTQVGDPMVGSVQTTIAAFGTIWGGYFQTSGAARVAVQTSNPVGASGTADLFVVQTAGNSCSGGTSGLPTPSNCTRIIPVNITAASSGPYVIIPQVTPTYPSLHVCYVALTFSVPVNANLATYQGANGAQGNACTGGVLTTLTGTFQNVSTVTLDLPNLNMVGTGGGGEVCLNVTGAVTVGGLIGYAAYQ